MPTDTKHDDLQSLRIDHSLRDGGGEPPPWSRRIIIGGIAVVVLLGIVALAYRVFASEHAGGRSRPRDGGRQRCGRQHRALRQRIHCRPPQDQRELQSHRPRRVDRRRKRRQGERRTGSGPPGRRRIPRQVRTGARRVESAKARLLEDCSMARVLRKFSRRTTISPKPAPPPPTTRSISTATAICLRRALSLSRISTTRTAKYDADQQRANSLEQCFPADETRARAEEI